MPTHLSLTLIAVLQTHTEDLLHKAISEWQMIPHSQFALRPAADKWSANECLQHLNSYGVYYLPAMGKAIQQSVDNGQYPGAQFTSGWLGDYFTRLMQPQKDGRIKKMKAPGAHVPKSVPPSHEVIATFIDQQEKLLQLLEAAKKIDLGKTRVAISIAPFIRLKLGDVFSFLIAHEQRHALQAERALLRPGTVITEDNNLRFV